MIKDLNEMTDEEVLDAFDSIRSDVSYYNAAEGNWSRETTERNAAKKRMQEIWLEIQKRNLTSRPGNYLL
jgi:hypothetical protein